MTGLQRNKPLGRGKPLERTAGLASVTPLQPGGPLQRGGPVNPVSSRRRAENRQRAAMADARWPGRRDGTVLCAVWEAIQPDWCDRWASDLHEIVRRAQGGSITSEDNTIPVCRPCNSALADGPGWGYRTGVIKHDALCCRGRATCAQYEPEEAA